MADLRFIVGFRGPDPGPGLREALASAGAPIAMQSGAGFEGQEMSFTHHSSLVSALSAEEALATVKAVLSGKPYGEFEVTALED